MIGHDLLNRLEQFHDCTAIVWRGQEYSYYDLLTSVELWRNVLAEEGVRPGDCVAFSGNFSFGTVSFLLALITNENIALPLTRSVLSHAEREQRSSYATALVEFSDDDEWHFRPLAAPNRHPLLDSLRQRREPGLVLFSSGSTGESKASLLSVPRLLAPFRTAGRAFRMLTFLLLDHMGGINTLMSILCNGGTAVTVEERTVDAVCRAIQDHRVDLLPATPTFLNMLLMSEAPARYDLSSIQYISYGTEPMPKTTLTALESVFPAVKFRQLYGTTELGILPTKTHPEDALRIKLGGDDCEVRVVDGILWIRTKTAMLGYLNAPPPFDADGWFNTGDAVIEEDGYVRVIGRASELINVGGEKVFPAEVENVILEIDNVRDVVVWGKPNAITGRIVAARLLLDEPEALRDVELRVRKHCRKRLAQFKVPAFVEIAEKELYNVRFKRVRRFESPGIPKAPAT
jgi:long-chain acyl-CoA synthetase